MNKSIIIYGEPGMGKTVLAMTALDCPKLQPVLMLDVEQNVLSVQSRINTISLTELGWRTIAGKADRIPIKRISDFQHILDWIFDNPNYYKSIIIDSLTEVCYKALSEYAGEGKVRKASLQVIPVQIQHYGINILLIKQLLDAFKQLEDTTVIYTCLEDIDKIEGELVMRVRPDFPGKLSREVIAKVHVVGNLSIKIGGTNREIRFQPTAKVVAKDQSENGKLGATMENPTMTKIMEKLNG